MAIARRLGLFWGKSPSPSALVSAIAQAEIAVGNPFVLSDEQVKALRQAAKDLVDAGHTEAANIVIALLIDRGDLEPPFRQSLLQQFNQTAKAWRILLDDCIKKQQPFRLLYRNAQGRELEFTVRHAHIRPYENRSYLMIWCEETADVEPDIPKFPELWHNRCLRLDRIQSMTVLPISGQWHNQLDTIEVQLHLSGGLAKAYEPKPDDTDSSVQADKRIVMRRVVNLFWLIREVRRYGPECVIVSPEALRDRFRKELTRWVKQYESKIPD